MLFIYAFLYVYLLQFDSYVFDQVVIYSGRYFLFARRSVVRCPVCLQFVSVLFRACGSELCIGVFLQFVRSLCSSCFSCVCISFLLYELFLCCCIYAFISLCFVICLASSLFLYSVQFFMYLVRYIVIQFLGFAHYIGLCFAVLHICLFVSMCLSRGFLLQLFSSLCVSFVLKYVVRSLCSVDLSSCVYVLIYVVRGVVCTLCVSLVRYILRP